LLLFICIYILGFLEFGHSPIKGKFYLYFT